MSNKMTPEMRFKGFTQDWEQRKLKEIAEIVTGSTPKTSDKRNYIGEYLFASPADIQENRYIDKTIITLTEKGFNSGRRVRKGASLFVSIGSTIGKVGQASTHLTTNQQINSVIGSKLVDDNFLYSSLFKESSKIKQLSATQAVPIINKTTFSNIEIFIANLEEQKKIGTFLKKLDDTIALHQDKLDKLNKLKKGYLQVMFPQKGAKTPRLRFAHFSSDWEQRKFKDFITKAGKKNSKGHDYPAYSVNNKLGLVSQKEQFDNSRLEELDKTTYKMVEPDEFAYNPARINIGSIAFNHLNKTVIVSSLYVVLKMSKKLNDEYVLQFVNSPEFITEVKRNTEGSVREYLFFESFKNIRFPYTNNLEKQKKLGSFFKQLDGVIALHQKKISTLQETKKLYLQKMFA
ncbi:restriction endonuclease subunit S [Desemzia sp. RIT804]|uniref:restriction endonuclease subunit S n=1 Tax=Desemzia sp. RIT 804 TaxID=2810209 RepID=UPI00195127F0|nr:restriction endonuclease subunit S [Desemzia sp. RIT 804]MBM6613569.1 restriction endonuclease subunit S [Desemzia sp. RIT 804]